MNKFNLVDAQGNVTNVEADITHEQFSEILHAQVEKHGIDMLNYTAADTAPPIIWELVNSCITDAELCIELVELASPGSIISDSVDITPKVMLP